MHKHPSGGSWIGPGCNHTSVRQFSKALERDHPGDEAIRHLMDRLRSAELLGDWTRNMTARFVLCFSVSLVCYSEAAVPSTFPPETGFPYLLSVSGLQIHHLTGPASLYPRRETLAQTEPIWTNLALIWRRGVRGDRDPHTWAGSLRRGNGPGGKDWHWVNSRHRL